MNDKIAINIVLIPSKELIDYSIAFNKKAKASGLSAKELGYKDYVPHITLAFGVVETEKLSEIYSLVENISKETKPIKIFYDDILASETKPLEKSYLEIKVTPQLQKLHKKVANILLKYYKSSFKLGYLYKGEETGISQTARGWLMNFLKDSAFEKYHAHITLRCGKVELEGLPKETVSNAIAIYQLGESCTCRKLLKKYNLG